MSARLAEEFRKTADKWITGPHAKALCEMLSQNAFLLQFQQREREEGGRVISAFFELMKRTIEMARKVRAQVDADREEMKNDELDQEAPSLA